MSKPFSPEEALASRASVIPDFVINAVNSLLAARYSGSSCQIEQKEIIEAIKDEAAKQGLTVTMDWIFEKNWLDFEPLYEKEGWKVVYDKPGYCESYSPFFIFSRR